MKKYVVFGAGNIGFGLIEKLSVDAEVHVLDIREPLYLTRLMETNHRITFAEVNAIDETSVAAAFTGIPEHSVDGAILTVGVSSEKTAFEDFQAFRRTVNINFLGNIIPIRIMQNRQLFKNPAKIIVLASTSGHFAGLHTDAYAPSKWLLVNACDSIRTELKEHGITLDLINPRTVKNERSREFKSNTGIQVSDVVDKILKALKTDFSGDCFIPGRYRLFHVIERLSPWMFDTAAHLPLHCFRKPHYQTVHGTALITGASSGLGRELTVLFAEQCSRIYVTARNLAALEELKNRLADQCEIIPIQVDFEKEDAAETVRNAIGNVPIDLLINNAGRHVHSSILKVESDIIKKTMETNFYCPIGLIAAFPNAKTIVNILSTTAISGRRNLGVYSSAKAGLWCFSKALRRSKGKEINVIDVIPATFQSALASKGYHDGSAAGTGSKKLSSANDGLDSASVAKAVKKGIDRKKDVICIPNVKTKLFIALEALAPKAFHRMFQ